MLDFTCGLEGCPLDTNADISRAEIIWKVNSKCLTKHDSSNGIGLNSGNISYGIDCGLHGIKNKMLLLVAFLWVQYKKIH